MADNQWRRQPFTGDVYPVALSEVHTVRFFDDWNSYGIQLDESIYLENPSSVSIVENVTGGTVFTEIPRTSSPSAGQFRVDYEAQTYTGTSRIQFNPSDNGTVVLVEYKGLGILNKVENYVGFLVGEDISCNSLTADADLTVGGDVVGDTSFTDNIILGDGSTGSGNLTMTGLITGNETNALEIDPNAGTIQNLQDGVAPSDAATVGQLDEVTTIQVGATGTHAPAGTQVKMAWFEGTTDGSSQCEIAHGLGSSIMMVMAYGNFNSDGSGNWTFVAGVLGFGVNMRFNDTTISFFSDFIGASKPVRFLVWYKG